GVKFHDFVFFSQKNVEKMKANYAQTEILPALADQVKGWKDEIRILVLGADWCGDAVANVPSIARLAEINPKIELRILDRDRHDELMGHFLTNGGKAIPKAIIAPANMMRYVTWGPRPAPCQKIMNDNKDKIPKEAIYPLIRAWYENDKNKTLLNEIWEGIKSAASPA
ncbi:thioredoxin family protein, partial [Candidatus Sumerlaeota bacterium]|nr:thioredoxin family protein [Candidatus Sumerlaeota bacterium]